MHSNPENRQLSANKDKVVLDRLMQAIGSKKYTDLAMVLGVKPQSISDAKTKGKIPAAWAVTIAAKYDITLDWLLFGIGPAKRSEGTGGTAIPLQRELELKVTLLEQKLVVLERENELLEQANSSYKEALQAYKVALDAITRSRVVPPVISTDALPPASSSA